MVNKGGFKWKLAGPNLKVRRLAAQNWDQAAPDPLDNATDAVAMDIEEGWPFYAFDDRLEAPITLAFQSGSGAIGLMQITGRTKNPSGLTFRYKLVRNSTTNDTATN